MSTNPSDATDATKQAKQRKKRGEGVEAKRVQDRLRGFQIEDSPAFRAIQKQFTGGVTHSELKSIALILCEQVCPPLKLDRDASRDNRVLIRWFDEHWDKIRPVISKIHLRDENENIITSVPDGAFSGA